MSAIVESVPGVASTFFASGLAAADPAVYAAVARETERQRNEIELIASENIVSRAVLEAAGSPLTNKYAEGYPGRRYYGGCQYVDEAEALAINRAKQLFDCNFANVQPSSGSQANQAVLLALAKPGDTILGLSLAAGGHLTHGAAPNLSGKWFKAVHYGVRREDQRIDLDAVAELAREHRPRIIVAGGSAYPRVIDFARFRAIADEVGAHPDGGHGALRRPGGGRRASEPARARPCRDQHHAQDAARPARRADPHQPRGHRPARSTRRCSPACRAAR